MGAFVAVMTALIMVGASDWESVAAGLDKRVPRIETQYGKSSDVGVCSGVVLNAAQGFILTAAHCVDGKNDEMSITVNGRHAEVARANHLLDLAVLRFTAKDEQTLPLAIRSPGAGADIAIAGYLLGAKTLHVQFGRISARRNDQNALVLDGAALGGDSGGPIVNAAGELVGMTTSRYTGSAISLAVPVESVRDFVEQYLPTGK
jgi:serine protease Do